MKILIVDDEQLDLFISKKLLSLEFNVEGFTSLPETIQWVKDNSFDVLISDFYLEKGIDAHRVLKEILAVKPKKFKAYVLSSHFDNAQITQLKATGYDDVIDKPLSLEKFKTLISSGT